MTDAIARTEPPSTSAPAHEHDELDRLSHAIAGAAQVLLRTQLVDAGATQRRWDIPCDLGPATTAYAFVVLCAESALEPDERADGARWLRAQQRPDGGFPAYPHAAASDVGATATVWAALHVLAPEGSRAAIASARRFVDAHGGTAAVVAALQSGSLGAFALAQAGLLDARAIPAPVVAWALVPPFVRWLEARVLPQVPQFGLQLAVLLRHLRGEWALLGGPERRTCVEWLTSYQNASGSWNDNAPQTALALAVLPAAGVPADDSRRTRAVAWLRSQIQRDATGCWVASFGSAVWCTAFDLRALLLAGLEPADPCIADAVRWLLGSQCTQLQPRALNRKPGAVRTGGWAFQRDNQTMPDCDDTGVVLAALGRALETTGANALPAALAADTRAAADRAMRWLGDMQNPDGGWSAFAWGLPGKSAGPAMERPLAMDFANPLAMARFLLRPPLALGDPSTEDVTARVLHGLGAFGRRVGDPMVDRALEFLREQQCDDGAFWGRWTLNYVAGTAWVVRGAIAVGDDPDETWLRNALDWLESKQSSDGGWGETPDSYADRRRAAKGPSMPGLTGMALAALVAGGRAARPAAAHAARYLVRTQRSDGTWPGRGYLATNIPPDTFYALPETEWHYPLGALAQFRAARTDDRPSSVSADARWSDAVLDAARTRTDPVADDVVRALLDAGAVTRADQLFALLLRSDDPIPRDMPPAAAAYFDETEALPAWADAAQLARAQALFERAGWQIAAALFGSSLPQAYASASGVTALAQTRGMRAEHVDQRVFETAQFLFDVLDAHAFDPQRGRAVRAAQKVRLMHAGVRRLIDDRGGWDAHRHSAPINQEDLAGTLMTFSVVTLDALDAFGVPYTRVDGEAWLHSWKVVGHFLGVEPALMPVDVADGRALMAAIRRRHWSRSASGVELTRALLGLMRSLAPPLLGDTPAALVRFLAGDHCADLLDVPQPNWNRLVFDATAWLQRELAEHANDGDPLDRLAQAAGFELMRGVVQHRRDGKAAQFRVPTALVRTVVPGT